MWTCPRCGARLVGVNMWHSCGPWTVEAFLVGKGPHARELFDAYVALVHAVGPFDFAPAKTRLAFMTRVRFAGVTRLSDRGMTCGFWLKRRVDSPRFTKVEYIPNGNWVYSLRITEPSQLDDEVETWLRETYEVGLQRARGD